MEQHLNQHNHQLINDYLLKIDRIENDNSNSIFDAKIDTNLNAMIVKINLNRAVFEHASFFKQFSNILLSHDIRHFVLDFSSTEFLDSTFLGSLIHFFKQVKNKKCKLSMIIDLTKITILSEVVDLVGVKIFASINELKHSL